MKRIIVSAAVLSLAVAGVSSAQAAPAVTKITGGGQTLVPAAGGAGDTVGFNAQVDEAGNAKGQFQYVKRNGAGNGTNQQVFHGEVTCAAVFPAGDEGGMAAFGGSLRDGTPFRVDVTDNGQGAMGMDMILVRMGPDAEDSDGSGDTDLCDEGDRPDQLPALNRGNVKIHKAAGGESGGASQGGKGRS